MKNCNIFEVHWKILFLGVEGLQKNNIVRGDCLKRKGSTVCRVKLGEAWQERGFHPGLIKLGLRSVCFLSPWFRVHNPIEPKLSWQLKWYWDFVQKLVFLKKILYYSLGFWSMVVVVIYDIWFSLFLVCKKLTWNYWICPRWVTDFCRPHVFFIWDDSYILQTKFNCF